MIRRNLLVLLVSAMFALSLAACSSDKAADLPQTDPTTTEDTTTQTNTDVEDTQTPVVEDTTEPEPIPELDDIFFAFDKSDLSSDSKRRLENNAKKLKDAMSVSLTIEGHCDERGTNAYNLALGERRAKAARDYLASLGVATSRMTTISYGEERPFATGHTEQAWSLNRRAHFVVTAK